jgi:hypothetical protein
MQDMQEVVRVRAFVQQCIKAIHDFSRTQPKCRGNTDPKCCARTQALMFMLALTHEYVSMIQL